MLQLGIVAGAGVYMALLIELAWRSGWLQHWAMLDMMPQLDDLDHQRSIRRSVIARQLFDVLGGIVPITVIVFTITNSLGQLIFAYVTLYVFVAMVRRKFTMISPF